MFLRNCRGRLSLFLILFLIGNLISAQTNNWVRTNPGGGGAIAVVGATANGTIISASDLSGIYITTNHGASWRVSGATQGLLETSVTSLGFTPTNGNTFILGTGIGAYKSTDGGNTFFKVNLQTVESNAEGYVESIGMSLSNDLIGYLAHYENWNPELTFMKTTDGGDNWVIVPTTGIPIQTRVVKIIVDRNNPHLVYALGGKARFGCSDPFLYKSENGGSSWTRIATDLSSILDFDLHPTDPNIIYASTFQMAVNGCSLEMWQYAENHGELYKSTNGGTTFSQIFNIGGIISVGTNPNELSVVNSINVSSAEPNSGTFKTTDGGSTWTKTGLVQDWYKGWAVNDDYAFSPGFNGLNKTLRKDQFNPNKMYGSFGQWAWGTTDSGDHINNISTKNISTDTYLSTGMENINGNWIDISNVNPNTVYVGYYDLGFWYTRDHGASWKRSLPDYTTYPDYVWWEGGGSNCNFVVNDPERENVVWACFSEDQPETKSSLFKSTEFGENWKMSNNGLITLATGMHGMSLDINSPVNNRTLYLTQEGEVYKSVNDGSNWKRVSSVGGLKFTEVDNFNSQLVYAGGENGLWRSTDGGTSWDEVGLPEMKSLHRNIYHDIIPTYPEINWDAGTAEITMYPYEGVFEIKADPNIANRVYVVAYGKNKGLYRSDDAGINWKKLYTNDKMRGVAIASQNSNIIYTSSSLAYHSGGYDSTSLGFLVSYDGGTTWSFDNSGMTWTNGGRMEIETGDSPNIWAWSPGPGIQMKQVANVKLQTKICIEEAYSKTTYEMIARSGITISKTSPFSENKRTVNSIPDNVVDWGLVQLKKTATGNAFVSKSVFINKDGRIVADDGNTGEVDLLAPEGDYFIIFKRRNHFAVMSRNPVSLNGANSILYDFTTGSDKVYSSGKL